MALAAIFTHLLPRGSAIRVPLPFEYMRMAAEKSWPHSSIDI